MFHETLGMRLRGAYLPFHRLADACFARFGLTADQFVVLTILAERDGLTQCAVAKEVFSDPNTVGAMLGRLEKKRLLRRERHPGDGRARCVFLTAQGRKVQREAFACSKDFRQQFDTVFQPEELEQFLKLLARFQLATASPQEIKADVA